MSMSASKFHMAGTKSFQSFSNISGEREHFRAKLEAALQGQDCPEAVRLATVEAAQDSECANFVKSDAHVDGVSGYLYKTAIWDPHKQDSPDIAGFVIGAEFMAPKTLPRRSCVSNRSKGKGILWRKEIGKSEGPQGARELQPPVFNEDHGISRSDLEAAMAMLESKASECAIRSTVPIDTETETSASASDLLPKGISEGVRPDPEYPNLGKWNIINAFLIDPTTKNVLYHRATAFQGGQGAGLFFRKAVVCPGLLQCQGHYWEHAGGSASASFLQQGIWISVGLPGSIGIMLVIEHLWC